MNAFYTQPLLINQPKKSPNIDEKTSLYNEIEGLYFMLKLTRRKLMKLHRNIEHGKNRRLNITQTEILENEKTFNQIENICTN